MTRTRTSAKQAGSQFETDTVKYLQQHLGDHIERRARNGSKDRGDLTGWKLGALRIVAELKNVTKLNLSGWVEEAEIERGNDDAHIALVIHKRRGKGPAHHGETYVTLTLENLLTILTGNTDHKA